MLQAGQELINWPFSVLSFWLNIQIDCGIILTGCSCISYLTLKPAQPPCVLFEYLDLSQRFILTVFSNGPHKWLYNYIDACVQFPRLDPKYSGGKEFLDNPVRVSLVQKLDFSKWKHCKVTLYSSFCGFKSTPMLIALLKFFKRKQIKK